jgi:hypothetical protein
MLIFAQYFIVPVNFKLGMKNPEMITQLMITAQMMYLSILPESNFVSIFMPENIKPSRRNTMMTMAP